VAQPEAKVLTPVELINPLHQNPMKAKKEEIPVTMESPGTTMRALPGYSGMTVAFNERPVGTDFSPLLVNQV
jgi:hypothetical protein